jgi:choline dehydrogenase
VGDDAYNYEKFLPYYKRSCTITPPNWEKRRTPNATFKYDASAFSSTDDGPIQVSWTNWVDPTTTWLARALQAMGMGLSTEGFNSGTLGLRSMVNDAHLTAIRGAVQLNRVSQGSC